MVIKPDPCAPYRDADGTFDVVRYLQDSYDGLECGRLLIADLTGALSLATAQHIALALSHLRGAIVLHMAAHNPDNPPKA